MELNNVQLAMEKDSDKKEKTTPLLALLKELIVEKGFDPALMDEPFLIDQINTFDKDKRGYSKDEANNILKHTNF